MPENDQQVNVRASEDRAPISMRTLGAGITGIVTGIIGDIAAGIYSTNKLIPFDREVARLTREDIINRGGLGAGIAESGAGSLGPGMGSHIIEESHAMNLITQEEFRFAKLMRQIGGRGNFKFMASLGAGALGALAFLAVTPKREKTYIRELPVQSHQIDSPIAKPEVDETDHPKHGKNWQASVAADTALEQAPGRS